MLLQGTFKTILNVLQTIWHCIRGSSGDGVSRLLRNAGKCLPDYRASNSRIHTYGLSGSIWNTCKYLLYTHHTRPEDGVSRFIRNTCKYLLYTHHTIPEDGASRLMRNVGKYMSVFTILYSKSLKKEDRFDPKQRAFPVAAVGILLPGHEPLPRAAGRGDAPNNRGTHLEDAN
jgi:hypothetical protein